MGNVPWISFALIAGGIYLITKSRVYAGLALIGFTIGLNLLIQFIKHGGVDAIKRN